MNRSCRVLESCGAVRRFLALTSFNLLVLILGCETPVQVIKVATYNIYFLDDGISAERRSNLQRVIELLDADIIGFQEIQDAAALTNILPSGYEVAMLDDTTEVQELALAVRAPLRVTALQYVFPDTSVDHAFPRKRDLLQATVDAFGNELIVVVHHAKSRRGGRMLTDQRRQTAAELIVEHCRSDLSGKKVVLLGDFNDNPDDRSLNILEYGQKDAVPGIDDFPDSFLFNSSETLLDREICSYGYSYLFGETAQDTFELTVAGARAENNKWRDQEHDYFEDVKIKAILFDQILVSPALKEHVVDVGVFNYAVGVVGELSRIRFEDGGLRYTKRGSLASDHVPVWTRLRLKPIGT